MNRVRITAALLLALVLPAVCILVTKSNASEDTKAPASAKRPQFPPSSKPSLVPTSTKPNQVPTSKKVPLSSPSSKKSLQSKNPVFNPLSVTPVPIKITPESEALRRKFFSKVRFCDEPILFSGIDEPVSPWNIADKKLVTEYLEKACSLAPGLITRAIAFSPITIYRTGDNHNHATRVGRSYPSYVRGANAELVFSSIFFRTEERPLQRFNKPYELRLWTIIHELTHMADPGHKLSESAEWLKLLPRVLANQSLALRLGESSNSFCWNNGVPSEYTGLNEREALAEYCSAMILVQSRPAMDADIESYIQNQLLAPIREADGSIPFAYTGWSLLDKKRCSFADLNKAVENFNKALELDPNYLYAKYGKQLAEMRIESSAKNKSTMAQ